MKLGNTLNTCHSHKGRLNINGFNSFNRSPFTIFMLVLMLFSGQLFAAELKLSTDRSFVVAGDTFSLEILLENGSERGVPQATEAFDPALEVLAGPSMSSNTTIINGQRSSSTTWSWQILAKKQGQYEIPAFALNSLKTRKGKIQVKPVSNTPDDNSQDIIVTLEADKSTAFVGEQIILSWKVMFKTNVRGNIQPSELPISLESKMLEPTNGKDSVSTMNNVPYEVKEFRQVIFATEPGSFTIDPIFFKGSYRPSNSNRNRYQNITLGSNSVTLDIKPAPKLKTNHQKKIPITKQLRITSQWSLPDEPIDIGEPITLEVHMSAPGQIASRLPDITFPSSSNVKIYSDGEESREDSNWSIGTTGYRTQKFAIIPQKPGSFQIPDTRIAWWNTDTNKLEYTDIAGKTIQVQDAAGQIRADNTIPINGIIDSDQNPDDIVDDINNSIANKTNDDSKPAQLKDNHELWENLAYIFALLWLITGIYAYRSIQQKRLAQNSSKIPPKIKLNKNATAEQEHAHQKKTKDLSRKKVQLQIVPILELNPHDVSPKEACTKMVQLLCAWAGHESQMTPQNITQLIDLIEENDPWLPILQECESFLYGGKAQEWPKDNIRKALLKGLPQLHNNEPEKTQQKQNIAPFTP